MFERIHNPDDKDNERMFEYSVNKVGNDIVEFLKLGTNRNFSRSRQWTTSTVRLLELVLLLKINNTIAISRTASSSS